MPPSSAKPTPPCTCCTCAVTSRQAPPAQASESRGKPASGSAADQAESRRPSRASAASASRACTAGEGGERGAELLPVARVLDRLLERAVGETREVRERDGAPGVQPRRVGRRRQRRRRAPCRCRRASARAPRPRPGPRRDAPARRRRAALPSVASSTRQSGATARPSSIPPATAGPSSAGVAPELVPADGREPRRELVVAVVLPLTEDRLERRLPAGERAAHRLGEQLELRLGRRTSCAHLRQHGLGVGAERRSGPRSRPDPRRRPGTRRRAS